MRRGNGVSDTSLSSRILTLPFRNVSVGSLESVDDVVKAVEADFKHSDTEARTRYTALLQAACASSHTRAVIGVLCAAPAAMGREARLVDWERAMRELIRNELTETASNIVESMLQLKELPAPRTSTYELLINGYFSAGDWEKVMSAYGRYQELVTRSTSDTFEPLGPQAFNQIMISCRQTSAYHQAVHLIKTMRGRGWRETYTTFVNLCADLGQRESAFSVCRRFLYRELKTSNDKAKLSWKGDISTILALSRALGRPEFPGYKDAKFTFRLLDWYSRTDKGSKANPIDVGLVCNQLIRYLGALGDATAVWRIARWSAARGVALDHGSYHAAIRAASDRDIENDGAMGWGRAFYVFDWMITFGVPPDMTTYHLLMAACARDGTGRLALAVLAKMDAHEAEVAQPFRLDERHAGGVSIQREQDIVPPVQPTLRTFTQLLRNATAGLERDQPSHDNDKRARRVCAALKGRNLDGAPAEAVNLRIKNLPGRKGSDFPGGDQVEGWLRGAGAREVLGVRVTETTSNATNRRARSAAVYADAWVDSGVSALRVVDGIASAAGRDDIVAHVLARWDLAPASSRGDMSRIVWDAMASRGLEPDRTAYKARMLMLLLEGNDDQVIRLFEQSADVLGSTGPDAELCRMALHACVHSRRWDTAENISKQYLHWFSGSVAMKEDDFLDMLGLIGSVDFKKGVESLAGGLKNGNLSPFYQFNDDAWRVNLNPFPRLSSLTAVSWYADQVLLPALEAHQSGHSVDPPGVRLIVRETDSELIWKYLDDIEAPRIHSGPELIVPGFPNSHVIALSGDTADLHAWASRRLWEDRSEDFVQRADIGNRADITRAAFATYFGGSVE